MFTRKKVLVLLVLTVLPILFTLYIINVHGKDPIEPVSIDTNENPNKPVDTVIESTYSQEDNESNMENEKISGITTGKKYFENLVGKDTTNILLIGEDKAAGLYDTIGICSIDKENKKVKIIMIPRDTYIDYNEKIINVLKNEGVINEPGVEKINYAHQIGVMTQYEERFEYQKSVSFLADLIEEMFSIHIDDYVKVNTSGFVELVDIFGGVDIKVPYDMNYDDPFQDLSIHLESGFQHLNGDQAEGFVRFRQGYDNDGNLKQYGDIERKKNQILFIKAFIKQHVKLSNILKIKEIIDSLSKNVRHSLDAKDIITLTGIAKDIANNKYEIESTNIDGESKMINGASYIILDLK